LELRHNKEDFLVTPIIQIQHKDKDYMEVVHHLKEVQDYLVILKPNNPKQLTSLEEAIKHLLLSLVALVLLLETIQIKHLQGQPLEIIITI
jgi:hypothetical protein